MTDAHGSPPRNPLFNGWRPSERELTTYAAHGPVLDQATAFLTHITTTISLYTTITGGAWAAILSAALGLRSNTKLWLLGLHVIFSFFVFLSLWGVGNNFIQRLNFARWLGTVYWPRIEKLGGPNFAWKGTPEEDSGAQPPAVKVRKFGRKWLYSASPSITIRLQRSSMLIPLLALLASLYLIRDVFEDQKKYAALCVNLTTALSFTDPSQTSRESFERTKYLFDKAGCDITLIQPLDLLPNFSTAVRGQSR